MTEVKNAQQKDFFIDNYHAVGHDEFGRASEPQVMTEVWIYASTWAKVNNLNKQKYAMKLSEWGSGHGSM